MILFDKDDHIMTLEIKCEMLKQECDRKDKEIALAETRAEQYRRTIEQIVTKMRARALNDFADAIERGEWR